MRKPSWLLHISGKKQRDALVSLTNVFSSGGGGSVGVTLELKDRKLNTIVSLGGAQILYLV